MLKRICAIIAAALLLLTFAGCSEDKSVNVIKPQSVVHSSGVESSPKESAPTESSAQIVPFEPSVASQQDAVSEVSVMSEPSALPQPSAPSEPSVSSEQAAVSEQSVVSQQPVSSEQSVVSQQPVSSEQSVVSQQPVSSEQSVVSQQPVSSEQSVVSQLPVSSEQSVVSQLPVSSEQSVVSQPPVSSEQSVVSQQPVSSEQSVSSEQTVSSEPISQTVAWGLGETQTYYIANDRSYEWYVNQNLTGTYATSNCGPACAVMAAKWSDADFALTTEQARALRRPDGSQWYVEDIEFILNQASIPFVRENYTDISYFLDKLVAGKIVIISYRTAYLSVDTDPTHRVGRPYAADFAHCCIIKGYRVVDGVPYFEVYDSDGWLQYDDGQYMGKNRYYAAAELLAGARALNEWAVVVSQTVE